MEEEFYQGKRLSINEWYNNKIDYHSIGLLTKPVGGNLYIISRCAKLAWTLLAIFLVEEQTDLLIDDDFSQHFEDPRLRWILLPGELIRLPRTYNLIGLETCYYQRNILELLQDDYEDLIDLCCYDIPELTDYMISILQNSSPMGEILSHPSGKDYSTKEILQLLERLHLLNANDLFYDLLSSAIAKDFAIRPLDVITQYNRVLEPLSMPHWELEFYPNLFEVPYERLERNSDPYLMEENIDFNGFATLSQNEKYCTTRGIFKQTNLKSTW